MKYVDEELAQRVTGNWEDIGGTHYAWDAIAAGSFTPGINVGFDDKGIYFTSFNSHILGPGDSGSGKTCSFMETTNLYLALSSDKKNCLIGDSKGGVARDMIPLFESRGFDVLHVNPRSSYSTKYNPLLAVWKAFARGDKALAEERLAAVIEPLKALVHSTKDVMWEEGFENLVSGSVMAKMEVEPHVEPTLADIVDLIGDGIEGVERLASRTRDEVASARLRAAISCKEAKGTTGGILIVTQTALKFWSTNAGRFLTGRGGVDIEQALSSEKPSAIFITYPDEAVHTRVLASIFFDQYESVYTHNYETHLDKGLPAGRGARMVIDEWGMLPRVACMPRLLATARSRDLYVAASCQSVGQMLVNYTEAETVSMLGQFGTLIIFRNCDETIVREATLRTGGVVDMEDFAALPPGRAIILIKGKPALASQLPSASWLFNESPLSKACSSGELNAVSSETVARERLDADEHLTIGVADERVDGCHESMRGNQPNLDMQIEDFEFSLKTYNALKRAGVHTLGILLDRTADDLCSDRRFLREESLAEVVSKLEGMGLSLKKDEFGKGEPFDELKVERLDDLFADSDGKPDDDEAVFTMDCLVNELDEVGGHDASVAKEVFDSRVGDLIATFEHAINSDSSCEKASWFAIAVCMGEYGRDWRLLKFYERCYDFILARGFADGMIEYYPPIMSVLDEMARVVQGGTKLANKEMGSPYPLKAVCDVSSALGRLVNCIDEQGNGRCAGLARLRKDAHECIDNRLKGTRLFLGSLCKGIEGLFKTSGSSNVAEWFADTGPDGLHMTALCVYESLAWTGVQSDLLDAALADESLPLMVDLKASFDELFGDIVDSDELDADYEHVWDSEHMVFCDKAAWAKFERAADQVQDGEYAVGLESVREACLVNPGLKKLNRVLFVQGMAHFGLGNARESARYLLEYAKSSLAEQHVDRDDAAFAMIKLSEQLGDGDAALARELLEAAVRLRPSSLECRVAAVLALATMLAGEDERKARELIKNALDDDEWNDLAKYVKRVKKLRKRLKRMRNGFINGD